MAFKELGVSLLIFTYLINLSSSSPTQKTLPSDFMQKSKIEDKRVIENKIEGGVNGGKAHGNGGGNNGNPGSPNTEGGTAGATNNNHPHRGHHGAGNCNLDKIKFPTMLMITLVCPLMQLLVE